LKRAIQKEIVDPLAENFWPAISRRATMWSWTPSPEVICFLKSPAKNKSAQRQRRLPLPAFRSILTLDGRHLDSPECRDVTHTNRINYQVTEDFMFEEQMGCRSCARAADGRFTIKGSEARYAPDRTFDTQHIALDLKLDLDKKTLSGTCTTTLEAMAEKADRMVFDAVGFKGVSVTREGRATEFKYDGKKITVVFDPADCPGSAGGCGHPLPCHKTPFGPLFRWAGPVLSQQTGSGLDAGGRRIFPLLVSLPRRAPGSDHHGNARAGAAGVYGGVQRPAGSEIGDRSRHPFSLETGHSPRDVFGDVGGGRIF
jgi:hypothetical protein